MSQLQFIEQSALKNAVLFQLFLIAQTSEERVTVIEIAEQFQIDVGQQRITLACEALANGELIRFFPQTSRAAITSKGYDIVEQGLRDQGSFLAKYAASGDSWLAQQTIGSSAIPASDRVVNRSDNQKLYVSIDSEIDSVIGELDSNNEVGDSLGDSRDTLLAEVKASKELIKPGRFNLGRFAQLILPALKFLSEKFSGAAIGEAAKRLVALIAELF